MSQLFNCLLQRLPSSPRIAVIRALQLGDVLCAVPAWRALRAAVPSAEVTFIGLPWAQEFVSRFNTYFDAFREFPGYRGIPEQTQDGVRLRDFCEAAAREPYDLVIQMHGSGWDINDFMRDLGARRNAGFYPEGAPCPDHDAFLSYPDRVSEVERHLLLMEHLGAPPQGSHLEFPVLSRDEEQYQELVQRLSLKPQQFVCLHAGARWPSRRWPADRFAEVGDVLTAYGYQIVLTGSSSEVELVAAVSNQMRAQHFNLAGQTGLGVMVRMLHDARLVISNDTGMSHLAAAARTPSVVIVMGSDPHRWAPLNRGRHRTVMQPIDCRPCNHFVCPIGQECALLVTPEHVLTTARTLLNDAKHHRILDVPSRLVSLTTL